MIKFVNVSKIYDIDNKSFYAVKKANLEIEKGEMVAICGRSGAGKSTLLHIMGCLDTVSEGTYYLDGREVGKLTGRELAKIRNEKMGFVLQDFSLINHKTALYNAMTPMFFNDTPFRKMKGIAMNALESMGITDQAKKPVINMSGGQRQRVAIARALVNNPPIIFADEPTGNLDSETSNEIMKLFKKLNQDGKTIVVVTHDMNVAAYCSRTITISDGLIK